MVVIFYLTLKYFVCAVQPVIRGNLYIQENMSSYMTGSLKWRRWDRIQRKCPLTRECPLIGVQVSPEDRLYCIMVFVSVLHPPADYCVLSVDHNLCCHHSNILSLSFLFESCVGCFGVEIYQWCLTNLSKAG